MDDVRQALSRLRDVDDVAQVPWRVHVLAEALNRYSLLNLLRPLGPDQSHPAALQSVIIDVAAVFHEAAEGVSDQGLKACFEEATQHHNKEEVLQALQALIDQIESKLQSG